VTDEAAELLHRFVTEVSPDFVITLIRMRENAVWSRAMVLAHIDAIRLHFEQLMVEH